MAGLRIGMEVLAVLPVFCKNDGGWGRFEEGPHGTADPG
jgi:hypothetical protein